jgi:hypothetical protein
VVRHQFTRIVGASGLLFVLACGLGGAAPVAAECDGPIPSFREVAPTAKTIVIGDVIDVQPGGLIDGIRGGRWSRFTLKVLYVVRGSARPTMEVRDVPTQPCASGIVARQGDRIAIAFEGTAFTPVVVVNTAAWIRGEPPFAEIDPLSAFESITRDAVFRLAGVDPPETSTNPTTDPAAPSIDLWPLLEILLATTGVAFLVIARRTRN